MKYSKSGVMLPITRPVVDLHVRLIEINGKIMAGCENVNGINKLSNNDYYGMMG